MKVRVERAGNRIFLASDYPTPGLKDAIPGAYFNSKKVWTLPLSLETCKLLRERFGESLTIGPQLWSWAAQVKKERQDMHALAQEADADLKVLPEREPVLFAATNSRTYQRVAARFIADTRGRDGMRRTLLADTVGLGKTIEAMAAVIESDIPGPYLVVCPKTAVETAWAPELKRWMPGCEVVSLPDGRAKRDEILNKLEDRPTASLARTWLVIHPASVRTRSWWICGDCGSETAYRAGVVQELDCGHPAAGRKTRHDHDFPQMFRMDWGAVIADESDQSIIRLKGTPNQTRRGMEMLRERVREGGLRLAMSGTPFRSRPQLLWSTLNWLDPKAYPSYWNWVKLYWKLGGYSGYEIGPIIEDREPMLMESLRGIMLRRERADVRDDLPAKLYAGSPLDPSDPTSPVGVWLKMESKQEKAYLQMAEQAMAEIEGGEVTAVGALAELTRLKQFASGFGSIGETGEFRIARPSNKYDWLLSKLQEIGFPGQPATKVVVASQFTRTLNAFASWLSTDLGSSRKPYRVGMITGETSQLKRTQNIAEFEDPNSDLGIMLLNTKAGGSAITLDAAEVMVVLDETFISDDQEQLEGRIDNRQPERRIVPRTYYYLRSLDTVEVGIARDNAESKQLGQKLLRGGRSGVEYASRMLRL